MFATGSTAIPYSNDGLPSRSAGTGSTETASVLPVELEHVARVGEIGLTRDRIHCDGPSDNDPGIIHNLAVFWGGDENNVVSPLVDDVEVAEHRVHGKGLGNPI